MQQPFHDAMTEATRLTRNGQIAEATELIQQTLGGGGSRGETRTQAEAEARRESGARARAGSPGAVDNPAPPAAGPASVPLRGAAPGAGSLEAALAGAAD